jgi:endonuclease YncB( thermonuclease family)
MGTRIKLFCIAAALCAVMLGLSTQVKWHKASAGTTTISGPARVVDGDTVVVNGIHIRLKGVDAARRHTPPGEIARTTMLGIVKGSGLTCHLTGERTWRREAGFCFTSDGTDINQAIIAKGAALSCPRHCARYLEFEQKAALAVQPRAPWCLQH